jgi:formate-dependent nitrite reductase membrane component NrfD
LLKTLLFIGGVVAAGMILPLVLMIISVSIQNISIIRLLDGISGVLILLGALLLRFSVVNSGIHRPVEF